MSEREPTQDELLAMAYVDGELAPEERARVEERLPSDASLAREVGELQRLAVLARRAAPREPMDAEWQRLAREPLHRASLGLGWTLVALGALVVASWLALEVLRSALPLAVKVALVALAAGAAILVGAAVRARLRTRPYDPYTEVRR